MGYRRLSPPSESPVATGDSDGGDSRRYPTNEGSLPQRRRRPERHRQRWRSSPRRTVLPGSRKTPRARDLHSGKSPRFAVVAPIADRFRLPSTLAAAPRSARPSAATAGRAPRAPPRGISAIVRRDRRRTRPPPTTAAPRRAVRHDGRAPVEPSSPFTSAPLSTPSESPAGRPRSRRRLFALPFAPAPAAPVREPILR